MKTILFIILGILVNGKEFNNICDNLEVEFKEDLLDENTGMVDWRETQF